MSGPSPVLIIDDEPHIWHLLRFQFEQLGYPVRVAPTLQSGRAEILSGTTFGALLLDLHLPDGSGLDLLREQRARLPATVVVLTGEGEDSVLEEVERLGGIVQGKPFSPSKLAARVARLMSSIGEDA